MYNLANLFSRSKGFKQNFILKTRTDHRKKREMLLKSLKCVTSKKVSKNNFSKLLGIRKGLSLTFNNAVCFSRR